MNTNQIFSWNRFTATLRKEVAENWRTLILITLGVYLYYCIAMIISNLVSKSGSYNINPLFFSLIAAITAGFAFNNLKTRQGRVALLSSPSSSAEKFITNFLIYFIGAFVIFAVSFQLADITRYIFISIFGSKTGIAATAPVNLVDNFHTISRHLSDTNPIDKTIAMIALGETLGIGALFFMGSVLWPRRSTLKMAVVVLGITILKIAAFGSYYYTKFGNSDYVPHSMRAYFANQVATIDLWFDVVFYTLCLVLAWLIFKQKDVITLKWWK